MQAVFGIGNDVTVSKLVAPVNIGNYGEDLYYLIQVEDKYEPRQFEMDPYLRSYGFGRIAATLFVGGRVEDKLYCSRLNPGDETFIRIEVCNNLGLDNNNEDKRWDLRNVDIKPDPSTVPDWMTISVDPILNDTPSIHEDLEFLLKRMIPPDVPDGWKGVIYFRVTTDANIPDAERNKIHEIKFILTADGKPSNFPVDFELPTAWIGIKSASTGNVDTAYGKATNVVIKDSFPEFVDVIDAKLLNNAEKLTFEEKIGDDQVLRLYPLSQAAV